MKALDEFEQKSSPQIVQELIKKQVKLASDKALEYGITSFQDAGTSLEKIRILHELSKNGEIPIRLNVMLYENPAAALEKMDSLPLKSYNQDMFRAASVKAYMDGSSWVLRGLVVGRLCRQSGGKRPDFGAHRNDYQNC